MLNETLRKKIHLIELRTKRILQGCLVGDFRTKQKGFGLEFEQLADYQIGDDIRFVDWNSSARMNKMLIREYRQELNRTILLIVDGSKSTHFASWQYGKKDLIADIASALALAGVMAKDHVGLVLFTNEVEKYIPPGNSRKHAHHIMETLYSYKPKSHHTNINNALKHVMRTQKHESFVFLISDFVGTFDDALLKTVGKKHDLIAVRCLDKREKTLPSGAYTYLTDMETGQECMVSTHYLQSLFKQRLTEQNELFKRCAMNVLDLQPGKEFIEKMILFLKKRT